MGKECYFRDDVKHCFIILFRGERPVGHIRSGRSGQDFATLAYLADLFTILYPCMYIADFFDKFSNLQNFTTLSKFDQNLSKFSK